MGKKKNKTVDTSYIREYPDKVISKRLLKYLKPYKKDVMLLLGLTIFNSIASLAYPLGMGMILDFIDTKDTIGLRNVSLILVTVMIFTFFSSRAYQYNINKLGQYILYDLRGEMFTHIQELSVEYHTNMPTGKIMSRITNDVDTIQAFISNQIIQLVGDVIMVVTYFSLMLYFSWHLTLIILAILPIVVLIFGQFAKRSRYYYRQQRRKISEITRLLQESIAGVRTIKAFVKEDENIENFSVTNWEDKEINMQAAKIAAVMEPVKQVIVAAILGTVVFIGADLLDRGLLRLTVLLTYVVLATQFVGPMNRLGDFYNNSQSAFAAGDRVFHTLDLEPKIRDLPDAKLLPKIEGKVEYRNVWFEYEKDLPVLKDIDFIAEPKTRYAFVGFTGAGKTTLISLLSRFYDPLKGMILIDEHDIKTVTKQSLRTQIGVVLQDTFLFDGTVMDNIKYGDLNATDEEALEAAKKVGAHPFIMNLPEGYETSIQERGSLLSIGQRQLIAFARALLSDPPILVLDEATSSVDPYTELKIQEALEVLLKSRTSFVIAHRLSTILNADVICVMDNGEIIQRGSHEELISQGGLYKHLYELQFKKPKDKVKKSIKSIS